MAPAKPNSSKSLLPARRARQIFDKQIVPILSPQIRPQRDPRLILLGAQPGAGKTSLASIIGESLGPGRRPVLLDFDALRPFYPGYQAIKRRMGPDGDRLVTDDVYRWLTMAFDYVRAHHSDVLVEHTMANPQQVDNVVKRFADPPESGAARYRVEAAFLATAAADSRLGMLERYQLAYTHTGHGRHPGDKLHDQRYHSVLEAADWLDTDPRFEAVAVYRRGVRQPISRKVRDTTGTWSPDVATRQIMATERARPWDLARSQQWLSLHARLVAAADAQWLPSLELAWQDAQPLLDPAALVDAPLDQHVAEVWEVAFQAQPPPAHRPRGSHDAESHIAEADGLSDQGLSAPDVSGPDGASM
ncbi:zeta toxin family protein [Nocardia suismassiliense]|uniref:zeta toxin family protein n=1 Tax=Nocardia suismassiliense TaxID=2077092 RepID=UPI001F00BE8A|nr:zeta toxin family protein [Nocardia suismassiliense]